MNPKLSKRTISAVQRIITGNEIDGGKTRLSPYTSGPGLVAFFNELDHKNSYSYDGSFGSRWSFTEDRLAEVNGTRGLAAAIEAAVDPSRYLDGNYDVA